MRILRTEDLAGDRWLRFRRHHFINRAGAEGQWTFVERTGGQQAAVVIARTRQSGRTVLIRQWRLPMQAWVYEFPAGLVDPGEAIDVAARRELAEETGYAGEIVAVGPAVPTSPGMCTETVHVVSMVVDEVPEAHGHEDTEAIEVLTLEPGPEAARRLVERVKADGDLLDCKLHTWLLARMETGG